MPHGKSIQVPPAQSPSGGPNPSPVMELSQEQLARLAAMIADGTTAFPDDLSAPARCQLVQRVRTNLRRRLLSVVARAVAQDIVRASARGKVIP